MPANQPTIPASSHTGSPARVHWATAAVLGLAALTVSMGVWYVGYAAGLAPFPPFDFADQSIRRAPGEVAVWAIANLQFNARRLALLGGLLAFLALGMLLALALRLRPATMTGAVLGLALTPVAVGLAFANDTASGINEGIWLALWFGLTLAAPMALAGRWTEQLELDTRDRQIDPSHWLDAPGDRSRRDILVRAAGSAVVFGFGGWAIGSLSRSSGVGEVATAESEPLDTVRAGIEATPGAGPELPTPRPANDTASDFSVPDGVRPRITPTDEFYLIDISTRKPILPEDSWTVRVHGLVAQEVVLSYSDLLALPPVEMQGTAMCISFTYPNDLISSTRWTGVPLRDVLQLAGIGDDAVKVVFRGAGGYSDSIPVAKALEATTLLAYGMNGDALPRQHGFPCRVYVPNIYGEKSVKWLEEIEIVEFDYRGYWQERGWSDTAVIHVTTIIDTPNDDVSREPAGNVPVGGVAFAGSRGIQSVQVQVDDEAWVEATVEPYEPELVWQRWTFEWTPQPGEHTLRAKAIDGDGNEQPSEETSPFPDGMTGLHEVQLRVL